jgi:hypothetical protein
VALVSPLGEAIAHAISSLTLSAAILVLSWFTITWIHPTSVADAWRIGVLWLALAIAFEFLAGHYLFGDPWDQLSANYNVLRGRLWVLVLITTLVAPVIAARARSALVRRR